MPGKIFLSPLRKERALPVPPRGRWHSQVDFLSLYSADIPVEGRFDDRFLVHSVPTVFARPIQFYQALENDSHPAHASVTGQWRGLLALIALQRWLHVKVAAQKFSLPDALAGARSDRPLLSVLESQLPGPEEEWKQWWLLRCERELVGATSPWSLFYTPAEYHCPEVVPWQKDGRLIDPIDYFDPSRRGRSQELALLGGWLDQVLLGERDLWGAADRSHLGPYQRTLVRLLRSWKTDLRRYEMDGLSRRPLVEDSAGVREDPYRYFLKPLDVHGVQTASDLLLECDSGEEVLVFSKTGLDPRKRVYGPVLASEIDVNALPGAVGGEGWKTPAGRLIPCPYLVAEEAFFPPKLAEVPLSNEAFSVGAKGFALPLTPLFFRYFSLESLVRKGMLLDVAADDTRVTVRMKLPLVGEDHLIVERSYNRKTDVIRSDVPALAFWPDFMEPEWRHNLAFLSGVTETDLSAAPMLEGGATMQPSATDGSEATFRIWGSSRPLLGFALRHREGTSEPRDAGVVVRRALPRAQSRKGAPWKVAVDFGTSSTNLRVKEGGDVRPLFLEQRTVVLTEAASGFAAEVSRKVYPAEDVAPPFPTLLFRNDGTLVENDGVIPQQQDLYTPRFILLPEDLFYGGVFQPIKNLKWAGQGDSDIPLREYLTALVRAVTCEARAAGVPELDFEWSFPLSLPTRIRNSMTTFWQTAAGSFSTAGMQVRAHRGVSESEAVCRHLAPLLQARSGALSIAVDIGGGSTDIGFWTSGRLLGQVSLKLAGNDVLVPLLDVPGFLQGLVSTCDPTTSPDLISLDLVESNRPVLLNMWLAQAVDARGERFTGDPRNHPVPVALATRFQAGEPPWSVARTLIYLFTVGTTFFIGLQARKWMKTVEIKSANVRFGGRGAALLTWLARDEDLGDLLKAAFAEGLTLDHEDLRGIPAEIFAPGNWFDPRSPLKSEVVLGLLAPPLSGEKPERPTTTIVGEIGWRDKAGEPLDWDAEIGAAEIETLKPPPNHDSGYMAHFLSRVAPKHADELGLDLATLRTLRLDSAKVQNQLRQGVAEDQEVLQPVFAVELKVLMEEYLRRLRISHV
jgi:hypothetical protein